MTLADNRSVTTAAVVAEETRSYVDWPAIFAGTLIATAISFVLITFGSALGLSLTSAYKGEGISLLGFAIAAALWLLWVQISSFFAGGYLTGRMRRRVGDATEHESDIRDGSHGLVVWALGLLIGAAIAYSGVSGALSTAANAIGSAGGAAANAASNVAGQALDQNALLLDRLVRPANPGAAPNAPAGQQPGEAAAAPQQAGAERDALGRILMSAVSDEGMNDADRQYLIQTVAARAGIPPEEAQRRVDEIVQQAKDLEAKARAAAEHARKLAMLAAFITAASLFVSGAAAYYGATLGGNHRDRQTVFPDWSGRWRL
jgi:polyhydroxyalkanoate synthesis regulator phasin